MRVESDGIVIRQTKPVAGKRMLVIFTRKYGKISAGSSINEKGRNKSRLTLSPFTHGNYQFFKVRDSFTLNSAELMKSYYSIGEDVDKYMAASQVLEYTDRILNEGEPAPAIFSQLLEFLEELSVREKKFETLVVAYRIKTLKILGLMPAFDSCCCCGKACVPEYFSVTDGGLICTDCMNDKQIIDNNIGLIYKVNFDIINILRYFIRHPFSDLRKIALNDEMFKVIDEILKAFISYHLDIGELKSEAFKL